MDSELMAKIIGAGFAPPDYGLQKPDPRGKEYGRFAVRATQAGEIRVTKCSRNWDYEWSCLFENAENFLAWAKECT